MKRSGMRPSSLFSLITTILPRLAEAVVVKIDNLLINSHVSVIVPLIDRASRGGFNGGIMKKSGHFLTALVTEGQFLALQMVQIIVSTR